MAWRSATLGLTLRVKIQTGKPIVSLPSRDMTHILRIWHEPLNGSVIQSVKSLIATFIRSREPSTIFLDIHAHSRKRNVFMYGNMVNKETRSLPNIMARLCPHFDLTSCRSSQKGKENSARVAIGRDFNVVHAYTLEASFCGSDVVEFFSTEDYLNIGKSICEALIAFAKEPVLKSSAGDEAENENGNTTRVKPRKLSRRGSIKMRL